MTNKYSQEILQKIDQITQYTNYLFSLVISLLNEGGSSITSKIIFEKVKKQISPSTYEKSFTTSPRVSKNTLISMNQTFKQQIQTLKQQIMIMSKFSQIIQTSQQNSKNDISSYVQQLQQIINKQQQNYSQKDKRYQKIMNDYTQNQKLLIEFRELNDELKEENQQLLKQNRCLFEKQRNLRQDLMVSMKYSEFFYKNIALSQTTEPINELQARQYRALIKMHQSQIQSNILSTTKSNPPSTPNSKNSLAPKTHELSPYYKSIQQTDRYNQNLKRLQQTKLTQSKLSFTIEQVKSRQQQIIHLRKNIQLLEKHFQNYKQLKGLYQTQENYTKKLEANVENSNKKIRQLLNQLKQNQQKIMELQKYAYY